MRVSLSLVYKTIHFTMTKRSLNEDEIRALLLESDDNDNIDEINGYNTCTRRTWQVHTTQCTHEHAMPAVSRSNAADTGLHPSVSNSCRTFCVSNNLAYIFLYLIYLCAFLR